MSERFMMDTTGNEDATVYGIAFTTDDDSGNQRILSNEHWRHMMAHLAQVGFCGNHEQGFSLVLRSDGSVAVKGKEGLISDLEFFEAVRCFFMDFAQVTDEWKRREEADK